MIKLPHYNWFFQIQDRKPVTNVYTGSSGTEPSTGCFSIITFDYKVYVESKVEKNEDGTDAPPTYRLVAEWRFTYPFGHTPRHTEPESSYFEASPDGLAEAVKWLEAAESKNPEDYQ